MGIANNNMRGTDVACQFFTQGNKEVALNHLSFTIKENASEGVDDICGTDRSDPYTVTNFHDVDFEGTQQDMALLNEFMANIANKDAGTGENPAVVSMRARTKKGVALTYVFTGVTRKPWQLSASSRTDAFKFSAGFKCKYFKATPSAS